MEPKFIVTDSAAMPWMKSEISDSVQVKHLGTANGQMMELYRFAPNTSFPDHVHEGPEFVYMLEGEASQNGKLLRAGWTSVAEIGTRDENFHSTEKGCVLLAIYSAVRML